MAYLKTIFKGTPGFPEVWSTSNSWRIFGPSPDVPQQAEIDAIAAWLSTHAATYNPPAALNTLATNASGYTAWRVELRAENESLLSVSEANIAPGWGGAGAPSKTPQDALVFSLRTSTPGPTGRGRMYWPAMGATLATDWSLSSPTPATVAAGAKTWLNAIGSGINAAYASLSVVKTVVLAVRSAKAHTCYDVNQIQVGSYLDTQRRRRDSFHETYSSVSYP